MSFTEILNNLINRQSLNFDAMQAVMHEVMAGKLTSVQISALLIALRMKGETVDEIAAAANVMRELSAKVTVRDAGYLIDTCGTGGDGIQTFNVSTVSAFVAAAAGAKVAKHGGRSVSSSCGSADVLEALGVNVNQTPEQVVNCIDQIGVGFMFAPNHHSAMKHSAPVRRELGVRTLFNLLGPLTNPANAKHQLMGVFDKDLTVKLAKVLQSLGSDHVLVVHGADGMDEISFTGDTFVAELNDGKITEYKINPLQFGMKLHDLKSIRVENAAQSKDMILDVLNGPRCQNTAARDIVLLNAGAAIYVSGIAKSLQSGIVLATRSLDQGAAMEKLEQLVKLTKTES